MTIAAGWENPEQLRYLYNEATQTIEQLRQDKAELVNVLDLCLEFIDDAHIIEGRYDWLTGTRETLAKHKGDE